MIQFNTPVFRYCRFLFWEKFILTRILFQLTFIKEKRKSCSIDLNGFQNLSLGKIFHLWETNSLNDPSLCCVPCPPSCIYLILFYRINEGTYEWVYFLAWPFRGNIYFHPGCEMMAPCQRVKKFKVRAEASIPVPLSEFITRFLIWKTISWKKIFIEVLWNNIFDWIIKINKYNFD